jgi:endoglucanase Acf2
MVDVLLNDYMYPVKGDSNYAYLRSFDSWAGHSWAHGFGSFAEGNNLESTSEALNSWVGGYLWALATQDQARIDAAIYGFVTEFSAIREYWFDYDEENWSEDYSTYASVAGMVWGGKFDYATWFGANPTFIYGIQWLPNGEYLTNYGINADDLAKLQLIFEDYLDAKNNVIDTWYSNMWSVLAIYNPESAIAAFDASKILNDDYPSELAGAYWMINALSSLGIRTDTVKMHSNNLVASTIYMNDDGSIYAMVWNPTSSEQTIQFYNNSAFVYQTKVQANTFTKIEIPLL